MSRASPMLRRASEQLVVTVAVAAVVGVLVADLIVGQRVLLIGLLIAGPLLCSGAASLAATRWISLLAVSIAAVSFTWDDNFFSWRYWVPLAVVAMGCTFAAAIAGYCRRLLIDAERLRVLADLAQIAQSGHSVERVAQAVAELAIARFADLCLIEIVGGDGRVGRVGGASTSNPGEMAALVGSSSTAPLVLPDLQSPSAGSALSAMPVHLRSLDGGKLAEPAGDEQELEALSGAGLRAAVAVPLLSRGRPFGRMLVALADPGRSLHSGADAQFVQTFGGRVSLALENAVLSSELSTTERQLEVILENVGAAIVVRDINGCLIYANQAAAELLKLPDPEAVKRHVPGALLDHFEVYDEHGEPFDHRGLPSTRLLSGEGDTEPVTVRNIVKETGEERWLLAKASAVTANDGRVAMAVTLIEDVTQTKRTELAQRLLAITARHLVVDGDMSDAFQAITAAAVPDLADSAEIDLIEPTGIMTVSIANHDPRKNELAWWLRESLPVEEDREMTAMIRAGRPFLINRVTDEMLRSRAKTSRQLERLRELNLRSAMIAPIRSGDKVLGAFSFGSSTARRFDHRDLDLACDLGRQLGLMIDHAKLSAEQAEIARTLQAGLVPRALPKLDGWEVSSAYRAAGRANDVGGDFYDVIPFERGWAAIIGDVLGKGAEAAALTAMARHTVAAIVQSTGDVAHALQVLNRRLRECGTDFRALCTLAVVELSRGDVVRVYSAGHPLPLLRASGTVCPIGASSPMLGFLDEVEITSTLVEVSAGEGIILYTDGVLDALGLTGRFGERGLADALQAPTNGLQPAKAVMAAIDRFLAGEQSDDIAILSLTRISVPAAVS